VGECLSNWGHPPARVGAEALSIAAARDYQDIVTFLLSQGVDVSICEVMGAGLERFVHAGTLREILRLQTKKRKRTLIRIIEQAEAPFAACRRLRSLGSRSGADIHSTPNAAAPKPEPTPYKLEELCAIEGIVRNHITGEPLRVGCPDWPIKEFYDSTKEPDTAWYKPSNRAFSISKLNRNRCILVR